MFSYHWQYNILSDAKQMPPSFSSPRTWHIILYSANFLETTCWKFLGNYMLGNFLETICWEISWKLYAGNLLMETICWEIRVDTNGFLMGVIMAQCYGITLWFQGNGTRSSVEHPSSADLSRTKRSEQSYRKCQAGGWGCNTNNGTNGCGSSVGKHVSVEVNRKALA